MSRPKSQESPPKAKFAGPSGDLGSRGSSTPSQRGEKAVAEISMKDFLDFLKISYQINEAIDNPALDITEKGSVDWKKLTSDTLVSRLKEREALISQGKLNLESQDKSASRSDKVQQSKVSSETDLAHKSSSQSGSEEKLIEKRKRQEFCSESLSSAQSLDFKIFTDKSNISHSGRKKTFRKDGSTESETSRSADGSSDRTPSRQLKKKLNEVLQEGILDSVLPYLLPKHQNTTQENLQAPVKKLICDNKKCANSEKNEKSCGTSTAKEKIEFKRRFPYSSDVSEKNDKNDTEVIIHVCDEIKNLKRDFRCSQKLLLSNMGYFAEVTSGQKLEDMDISVHCDVTIFDWLMRWVQKDTVSEEHWPKLDSSIVVPVLMSSAFLQMNSLQEFCLRYCKTHINDVILDSPNLNCINDNVLTRLANLFTNFDIEAIVDKKDKIQSKLFCKLIVSLTEPDPQPHRGHFYTLATLYRCSKCLKLILKNFSNSILCVASNMKMDRNGKVHSTHVYDSSWNLTDYIRDLKAFYKSWRRVYWRLWADCHVLYCQVCEEYFPVGHMNWCRFHVDSVQYFPKENQRSVFHSIGRYPCCGERAYRFEVVKKLSGCQYREHVVTHKCGSDAEILKICNKHKDVILTDPPPLLPPDNKLKFFTTGDDPNSKRKEGFWWEGLELVPSKQTSGLLNKVWDATIKRDELKTGGSNPDSKNQKSPVTKSLPSRQSSIQDISSFSDSSDESCSSSNPGNSEESYHSSSKMGTKTKSSVSSSPYCATNRLSCIRKEKKRRKKKKKKNLASKGNEGNRFWVSKLSTRCNQDNQREFEERTLRQIESILAKKLSGESFRTAGCRTSTQAVPAGGIYVKLEQEWREAHCFTHGCPGSSIKARGSASHVNVNNSSFSTQRRSKSRGHR